MFPFVLWETRQAPVINVPCGCSEGGAEQGSGAGKRIGLVATSGWTAQGSPVVFGGDGI